MARADRYENPDLKAAIAASGTTKKRLADELQIGTTTLWRACRGWSIDADSARSLLRKFPQLNLHVLIFGDPDAEPDPRSRSEETESAEAADPAA